MPKRCALPSCNSKLQASSNTKVSIFKVPKELEKKEQWERATGVKLKMNDVVCSIHFNDEELIKQKVYRDTDGNVIGVGFYKNMMLAPSAIPSLYLPELDDDCHYLEDDDGNCEFNNDSDGENIILQVESDGDSDVIVAQASERTQPTEIEIVEENDTFFDSVIVAQGSERTQPIEIEIVEENNPVFDSLFSIALPLHWSRITPCNNFNCVVFACFAQDLNSCSLLSFKEVCVFKNGNIVYCYNGQKIETDLDTKLTTIEAVTKSIENFDAWREGDSN